MKALQQDVDNLIVNFDRLPNELDLQQTLKPGAAAGYYFGVIGAPADDVVCPKNITSHILERRLSLTKPPVGVRFLLVCHDMERHGLPITFLGHSVGG